MTCKHICKRGHPHCTFSGDGCIGKVTAKDEVILDEIIAGFPEVENKRTKFLMRLAMIKFRHATHN